MRINKFVALASGLSRRQADKLIETGQVFVNDAAAQAGQQVSQDDVIKLGSHRIVLPAAIQTIMLNKPAGYICSRDGQGSATIYDLLPPELRHLKPVGRLDKDSSGLLLLTNDGQLAHQLTHPKFEKEKVYEVELNRPLTPADKAKIEQGITLADGLSRLRLRRRESGVRREENSEPLRTSHSTLLTPAYEVHLREGRNRQIRRTFAALGYRVIDLRRTQFGSYRLSDLRTGQTKVL